MSSSQEFTPIALNTEDADAWDDTELVAAFDKAIASHRLQGDPAPATNSLSLKRPLSAGGKPRPKRPARANQASDASPDVVDPLRQESNPSTNPAPASTGAPAALPPSRPSPSEAPPALAIPPPPLAFLTSGPASADGDLSALLAAWYEAGYRAGAYAARLDGRREA